MTTPLVDTIFRSEIYLCPKGPDTLLVNGHEIISAIFHQRLPKDTVIQIDANAVYKVKDSLLTGAELIQKSTAPIPDPSDAVCWGPFFLGFVLGWNLYLINRHRVKTGVSIGDITVISTALISAGIFAFFGNHLELVGWYGCGVGAGFLVYGLLLFILLAFKLDEDGLPLRLLDLHTWPIYWRSGQGLKIRKDE